MSVSLILERLHGVGPGDEGFEYVLGVVLSDHFWKTLLLGEESAGMS